MWRRSMSSARRSSSSSDGGRAATALAVLLAAVAVVAGCSALDALRGKPAASGGAPAQKFAVNSPAPPTRTPFDHKFHLERQIACDDCHEGAEKADKAPMPTVEFCNNCHDEMDKKKPKERTVAA